MAAKKIEWITINEAVELVKGFYCKQTIYQFIWQKRLERRGPFHKAHVRKDQLLKVCKLDGIIDA